MDQPLTRLAAIQPPAPATAAEHGAMVAAAWQLVAQAARDGADLIVLPEYFNMMGLPSEEVAARAATAGDIVAAAQERCQRDGHWLVLPLIEARGGQRYNTAHLIAPDGTIALTYDKTHVTITERQDLGLTAGQAVPVVETPLGRVGMMICYDVYFPEVARLLNLQRTDLIVFPSLQRSDTPERCMLLNRARAMDAACHLVRACYGLPAGTAYAPGKVYGASCIIAPDGNVLADAGFHEGLAMADVDLRAPWVRPRCSGAAPEAVRDFLQADRRPELYGPIAQQAGEGVASRE